MRAPRLGQVKTRLAAKLGAAEALNAYNCLVEIILGRIASFRDVDLRYTPDDAFKEVEPWLKRGWRARPQGQGNLGTRMGRAVRETLETGSDRAVLIGSDCPTLTLQDIETAFSALSQHDLVLGPALDGGYWLIGLGRWHPSLFRGIDWGTKSVLNQTLERAAAARLRVCLLRTLEDIDTAKQWLSFDPARTRRARRL